LRERMEVGVGSTGELLETTSAASWLLMCRQDATLNCRPLWPQSTTKASEVTLATAKDTAMPCLESSNIRRSSIAAAQGTRDADILKDADILCVCVCIADPAQGYLFMKLAVCASKQ